MNKEELNYLKNISSTFTIYRGVAGRSFDEAINGISWTTNIKTAKEFAINNKKIYNTKNALIIEGCIKKQDIIAYFNVSGRYENEVIAEPSTILNTKIIK
jgi:hypothetical protein